MATYDIALGLFSDPELPDRVTVAPTSGNYVGGDVLRFTNNGNQTITVSGFDAAYFTSATSLNIPAGQTQSRAVKASPAAGSNVLNCSSTGYGTRTHTANFAGGIFPDPFNLGADLNGVQADDWYYSEPVVISSSHTGIAWTVSVSGSSSGVTASVNGGTYSAANQAAFDGDTVIVRVRAEDWNTTYTAKLTISDTGSTDDTFEVTTSDTPLIIGPKINFPKTEVPVRLYGDVYNFYGKRNTASILRSVAAGSAMLPDITENSHVPQALPTKLTNILGTTSRLDWNPLPAGLFYAYEMIQPYDALLMLVQLDEVDQAIGINEFGVGYNPEMNINIEVKYDVVHDGHSDVTVSSSGAAGVGVYGTDNGILTLTLPKSKFTALGRWEGDVTIYARHKQVPGTEITLYRRYQIFDRDFDTERPPGGQPIP